MNNEYLENNTVWKVKLKNGADFMLAPNFSWYDLKKIVKELKTGISNISLHFRSNIINVWPNNAKGYFFIKGLFADWFSDNNLKLWNIGHVDNNFVYIKKIIIPELIIMEHEIRNLSICSEECIIWDCTEQ